MSATETGHPLPASVHQGAGPVRRLLVLARPARGRLLLAVAAGSVALGSAVGLLATSAWLISRAAQHPPVLVLGVAVAAVRGFAISRGVFRYAERLVSHDAAFRQLADLRVRMFRRLEPRVPGATQSRRGDLLARLVSDVDTVQDLYLRVLEPVLVAAVVSLASVLLAAWLLPGAGLVLLVSLAVAAVAVPAATAYAARAADQRTAGARAELSAETVEALRAIPDLIAYDAIDPRLARIRQVDEELTRLARSAASASGIGAGLAALAVGVALWFSILVGVPAVRSGSLPGVQLAVIVLLPLAAFEAVAALPSAWSALNRVRVAGQRIFAVTDSPVPVPEPETHQDLPRSPGLRLEGVCARWPGADRPAIQGVDLVLDPGSRVAVVGPTGAGKSTLAAVLLRFLDFESGSLRLGTDRGVGVRNLAGDDVRRVVGLCAQDAHIFDSTLRENLRLARPDAADEELWDVLGRVRLDGWARRLPGGLSTFLGERGSRVSGGERQRIALARALLADFPILVLDEPTAHLDLDTGDALMADLLEVTAGRTTLLITHRLAALESVDEILVLDEGRVAERGTYRELMAAAGLFGRLHEQPVVP